MMEGKAHVYGDNIDTDTIIPARYLMLDDWKDMAMHAMEPVDKEFVKRAQKGDIIIGGENFGSGSSREQAPVVLNRRGIVAVVAKSYASIFQQNCVEGGWIRPYICKENIEAENGDVLRIDTENFILENVTKNKKYNLEKFSPKEELLIKEGGLIGYTKKKLREEESKAIKSY